jgi:hypothetical protein
MIRCPHCSSGRSNVIGGQWDPRPDEHDYIRRRRRCKSCRTMFHTKEYIETDPVDPISIRTALSLIARAQQYLSGERIVGRGKNRRKG